jgi:hypothetical protein
MIECAVLDAEENQVDALEEFSHDAFQPMIKSLHIENFRCFQKLDIEDLGAFNIIVGNNGAGKTALLESIFLPGGGHDLVFRLRAFRGMAQQQMTPVRSVYESHWKDLFFKFSQSSPITISLQGSEPNSRILKIYYSPQDAAPLLIGFQPKEREQSKTDAAAVIPLTFETDAGGKKYFNNAVFDKNGALQRTGDAPPNSLIAFLPTFQQFTLAQQFSEIDVKNQKGRLIKSLQEVFPNIDDLSLQVVNGATDLYCTIRTLPEKIPVGLVSNGIHKLLTILVQIADRAGGVVLIDEFDNGIFHGSLESAWRAVFNFCKEYEVQLFASTHSLESLKALVPLLSENQDCFRLIKLKSLKDGNHTANIFKGKDFESALLTGVDPR